MTTAQIEHALNAQAATARAWQALCEARLARFDTARIAELTADYEAAHAIELAALEALSTPRAA